MTSIAEPGAKTAKPVAPAEAVGAALGDGAMLGISEAGGDADASIDVPGDADGRPEGSPEGAVEMMFGEHAATDRSANAATTRLPARRRPPALRLPLTAAPRSARPSPP